MKLKLTAMKIAAIFLLTGTAALSAQIKPASAIPNHPRILLFKGEETAIRNSISSDEVWKTVHNFIVAESKKVLGLPAVERVLIGRRLLDKSREALKRIFFLSYAWRITGDSRYSERAEKEMLAVSEFSDWNPSHFLDVAEMTMALAIGYDWLYYELSEESRLKIREAIISKGLKPSLLPENSSWSTNSHNWNQVCNAGLTYGALAVYEEDQELARKITDRARNSIVLSMNDYLPDGAYPEGYSYWNYGTSFNVMYLSAVEKLSGFISLPEINPGFLKTAGYLMNMTGPGGNSFNYSDAGSGGGPQPAMFWFSNKLNDPSLLWSEKYFLEHKILADDRLLPSIMIWSAGMKMDRIVPPSSGIWVGQGKNPVALMRSSWTDPDAIYVCLKAGSPSVNHGHMDIGSFIMEADGERWAMDFGMQDYNSLEQAGVDLWNMEQNSQRWEIFRYNNLAHNTLTVNNELQWVKGYSAIKSFSADRSFINAITSLTPLYEGLVSKAERGVAIIDNKYVLIKDEIETGKKDATIRWNLLTAAQVRVEGNKAVMTQNGKKLILKVVQPSNIKMRTWSTEPVNAFDSKNPGTIMTGFEIKVPSGTKTSLSVIMIPGGVDEEKTFEVDKLENWPKENQSK